jgi:acyl dehydratase
MNIHRFDDVHVGDALPELVTAPVTRHTLGLYAGASGDDNPLHLDSDFARQAGMPDVFAHGMLSMAYLGHLLTNWVEQSAIRSYSVRFVAITHVDDKVYCRATVADKFIDKGEQRVLLHLTTRNQAGEIKLAGQAVIALA